MKKVDLKKELKHLYQPPKDRVVQVDVPAMNFLMVDGEGDPNTAQSYRDALEVLYPLSYTLKFLVKKGPKAVDYGVMPLEGLWWADDMSTFSVEDKSKWKWTLMIMQPSYVKKAMVDTAIAEVKRKKNPIALSKVRFETFPEGKAAQIMHIGLFSEEGPTIEKVHNFIDECGRKRSGKHHEIYLSDIRKADPKKWKTIIRQPMA
jgi:hypothetical protein